MYRWLLPLLGQLPGKAYDLAHIEPRSSCNAGNEVTTYDGKSRIISHDRYAGFKTSKATQPSFRLVA